MILGYSWLYPLVMTNIAMEMAIEIVSCSMKHSVFPWLGNKLPEGNQYSEDDHTINILKMVIRY